MSIRTVTGTFPDGTTWRSQYTYDNLSIEQLSRRDAVIAENQLHNWQISKRQIPIADGVQKEMNQMTPEEIEEEYLMYGCKFDANGVRIFECVMNPSAGSIDPDGEA